MCSTAKIGLRQLKGNAKRNTRNKDRYVLLRHQRCSKKSRKPRVTTHDAREWYLGEPE